MPKETIQTSEGAIVIGWARDGAVQVAGYRTQEPVGPVDDSTPWLTLNRDGCNRAIRALRRARDAAYGADA